MEELFLIVLFAGIIVMLFTKKLIVSFDGIIVILSTKNLTVSYGGIILMCESLSETLLQKFSDK